LRGRKLRRRTLLRQDLHRILSGLQPGRAPGNLHRPCIRGHAPQRAQCLRGHWSMCRQLRWEQRWLVYLSHWHLRNGRLQWQDLSSGRYLQRRKLQSG
jgi:hypothetical protein